MREGEKVGGGGVGEGDGEGGGGGGGGHLKKQTSGTTRARGGVA